MAKAQLSTNGAAKKAKPSQPASKKVAAGKAKKQNEVMHEEHAEVDPAVEKLVRADMGEYVTLLNEYTNIVGEIRTNLQGLVEQAGRGECSTSKGVSYLDVKLHLLLAYCVHLAFLMLLKTGGGQIQDHPVVRQLVELRAFIEKIRPLDQKLKYQIDKLVKAANIGEAGGLEDPLRYKPNPDALVKDEGAGEGADEDGEEGSGIYVPPRLSAVRYDDDSKVDKRRKKEEALARELRTHDMYQDLKSQYTDEPVEVKDYSRLFDVDVKERAEMEHKVRFEEENYMRVMETKKEKKAKRSQKFRNELADITDFGKMAKLGRMKNRPTEDLGILKKKKLLKQYMAEQKAGGQKRKQEGGGGNRPKKMRS
eukprot:comp21693_c0_seq1/m.30580 comp21693_c0_seq1/g.30580  ORF comp21693_c0_seq1/g.30580 comp21693_c0_seq1/m.30580 type:complete len:366 (-) comp21693_c0_seq1:364-1461(-)